MFPLYLVDLSTNGTITVLGGSIRGPCIFIRNIRFSNHTGRFNRSPSNFRSIRSHPTSPPAKGISPLSFHQRLPALGPQHNSIDTFFVNALVRASLCKNYSSTYS